MCVTTQLSLLPDLSNLLLRPVGCIVHPLSLQLQTRPVVLLPWMAFCKLALMQSCFCLVAGIGTSLYFAVFTAGLISSSIRSIILGVYVV